MDADRFDALARSLHRPRSRRGALAAMLAGLLSPLAPADVEGKRRGGKGRGGGKDKGKTKTNDRDTGRGQSGKDDKNRGGGKRRGSKDRGLSQERKRQAAKPARAAAACYGGSNCTPGPGKNLSKCNYAGSATLKGKNLKGANLGNASVARGDASGSNLQGANLGGACLVDAKLTGATISSSTNFSTAIRCRTTMPDGSIDNAGCNLGTACCPTCDAAHPCPANQVCCNGRCRGGDCCTDAQCRDPDEPICLDFTCSPCTTNRQCGNGRVCCDGQCQSGNCCDEDDCQDRACQRKTCTANRCEYAATNGASCDDGDPCTVEDTCQNGTCSGRATDCSAQADACNDGVCRAADGQCVKRPMNNGTACSDNDHCTTGDSCQNGECRPGAGVDCNSLSDDCNDGVCRQSDGQCVKDPKDDGTPCGDGRECVNGSCEATCRALNAACTPSGNQCCQDTPTTCAALNPNCYGTGDSQNPRCCHLTGDTCSDDCECCAGRFCEEGACCSHTGSACGTADDCCSDFTALDCVSGRCCVQDGFSCEEEGDCCAGFCGPNGECQACLNLRQSCDPELNQCCQTGGQTICAQSFNFDDANCCRPLGGACGENSDCCDGVRTTCTNGRCCLGPDATCTASSECCPGFSCRGNVCRSDVCLEPGETCAATSIECCPEEGATCSGGTCCRQVGRPCVQLAGIDDPCCGSDTTCDGQDGATCCVRDFARVGSTQRDCTASEQCCSGYCHQPNGRCCRTEGASCSEMGALNFECCPYLGLTCSGRFGSCIRCRKVGQSCATDGNGNSTCCLGSACQNGTCVQSECIESGPACQENSVCCPGSFCDANGGNCIKSCEPEGERCGFQGSIFPCCTGLTCTGAVGSERCTR